MGILHIFHLLKSINMITTKTYVQRLHIPSGWSSLGLKGKYQNEKYSKSSRK
jgi:hypothetical protein